MITIEEQVKKVLARVLHVDVSVDFLKNEHRLEEDLDVDSLDAVEIMMDLEDEFDVRIPDTIALKVETVQEIIDMIKAHKGV